MNAFSIVGIFLSVFAWITVMSIMDGLQGEKQNQILNEEPHLMWEGAPTESLEQRWSEAPEDLRRSVRRYDEILRTEGLIEVVGAGRRGRGVVIQGRPRWEKEKPSLGVELGELLGLQDVQETSSESLSDSFSGSEVVQLRSAWNLEGRPLLFRPAGFVRTGYYEVDKATVFMNREELGRWLGIGNRISRVEIQLHDPYAVDRWSKIASDSLGLPLKTWKEMNAALWYSLRLERWVLFFSIFFVVVLASMAIFFSLTMRVSEKVREIALLGALGARRSSISYLYLAEGTLLGVVGSILGLAGAYVFCHFAVKHVQLPSVYYNTDLPVDWSWARAVSLTAMAVFFALLASWQPARKILTFQPSEALRA